MRIVEKSQQQKETIEINEKNCGKRNKRNKK